MSCPENLLIQNASPATLSGIVFDIKRFALHDGPGIRTTVFLKGCSLQCAWCHNPESQRIEPEIIFYHDRCTGCGDCVSVCSQRAIQIVQSVAQTDRNRCIGCGQCVPACPSNARTLVGRSVTVGDLVSDIESDTAFFDESGGGVTLSGGDPLLQPEFAAAILAACQRLRIHTTLDTCGFAPWEHLEQVARMSDLILYDLKHMDDAQHVHWTGQSNALILDNLVRLDALGKPLWIRIPFIPEINDDANHWRTLGAFIATLSSVEAIHLLPYHRAGEAKWRQLGRTSIESFSVPATNAVTTVAKLIEDAAGRSVYVGG